MHILPASKRISLLSFTVAVALARQSPASASPEEARRLNQQADAEFEASTDLEHNDPDRAATLLRRAGDLYWKAAQELAEGDSTRSTRSDLLEKSLSAYRQAQGAAPDRLNIDTPLRILREYTTSLESAYGANASSLPQYERALENIEDLTQQLASFTESSDSPVPSIAPVETSADRASKTITTEGLHDRPPSKSDDASPTVLARPSARNMKIGLGVSVGLASLAGLASLGTGLSLVRSPFEGKSYLRVESAFKESEIELESGGDLCALEHQQAEKSIGDACSAYTATRRASIATGIIAGVSLVSSAVFGARLQRATKKFARRRGLPNFVLHVSETRAVLHIGSRF